MRIYSPTKMCYFGHVFIGEWGLNIETHTKWHVLMFKDAQGRGCLIVKMQENTKTIPFWVQFWCSEDGEGQGKVGGGLRHVKYAILDGREGAEQHQRGYRIQRTHSPGHVLCVLQGAWL